MNLRPVKACHACGASYTLETWKLLREAPEMQRSALSGTETRLCVCGELLRLNLDQAAQVTDALPVPEHTASRAEPPPEALASEAEDDGDPSDGTDGPSAVVLYVEIPLGPIERIAKSIADATGHGAHAILSGQIHALLVPFASVLSTLTKRHQQQHEPPAKPEGP